MNAKRRELWRWGKAAVNSVVLVLLLAYLASSFGGMLSAVLVVLAVGAVGMAVYSGRRLLRTHRLSPEYFEQISEPLDPGARDKLLHSLRLWMGVVLVGGLLGPYYLLNRYGESNMDIPVAFTISWVVLELSFWWDFARIRRGRD